jgi:hypothetical protein
MRPQTGSFDVEDVLSELNVDEKIALLSGRSSLLALFVEGSDRR